MATSSRCRAVAACARFCGAAARGGGSGAGGPSYALNLTHGRTHYRPSGSYGYGGNGVLLSRGLLDAIPEHAWQLCARRLVCGSSDFRLASCVHNLAPRPVAHHEIRENQAFFRAALDRPDEKALGINVYYNTFFSTIHKDPKRGPRVLEHFARAHRPRCPRARRVPKPPTCASTCAESVVFCVG